MANVDVETFLDVGIYGIGYNPELTKSSRKAGIVGKKILLINISSDVVVVSELIQRT